VVNNAFKLGCNPFVTPYDIVQVRALLVATITYFL
jgi:hypothetical protein